MKLNAQAVLMDYAGKPIVDQTGKTVTFGSIALTVLNHVDQADSADMKIKRFKLSVRISTAEENKTAVDLTIEEAADLKLLIGKLHGPLVIGRMFELLEQD